MIVNIYTRDINGNRIVHTAKFEEVTTYLDTAPISEEDEILFVTVDGKVIYSALGADRPLTWGDITGFFG